MDGEKRGKETKHIAIRRQAREFHYQFSYYRGSGATQFVTVNMSPLTGKQVSHSRAKPCHSQTVTVP